MSRAVVSTMNRSDRSPGKGNRSTRCYACAFTLELPVGLRYCTVSPAACLRSFPFWVVFQIAPTRCRPVRNATSRKTGVTVSVEAVAAEPNYASRRSATPQRHRRVPSSRERFDQESRAANTRLPCAARRRRRAAGSAARRAVRRAYRESRCRTPAAPRPRDRRSPDGALERRGLEDGVRAKEPRHGRTITSRPRGFDVHAFRRLNSARRKTAYTIGIIARL